MCAAYTLKRLNKYAQKSQMPVQDVPMPKGRIPEKWDAHRSLLGGMDSPAQFRRPWESRYIAEVLLIWVMIAGSTEQTGA